MDEVTGHHRNHLIGLTAMPVLAGADTFAVVHRWDTSWWIWNDCLGESILGTGKVHEVYHWTQDASGGMHVVDSWRSTGLGYGELSGAKFVTNYVSGRSVRSWNGQNPQLLMDRHNVL